MKRLFYIFFLVLIMLSTIQAGQKIRLGVLDFVNNSGNPQLDYLAKALPEMLVTDLSVSSEIILVERSKLNMLLEEQQLNISGGVDAEKAVKIGQLIGADHLLFGSIFDSGEKMRFDARICNTSTGKIIIAEKIEIAHAADIIEGIDQLAQNLLLKLTKEKFDFTAAEPPQTFLPKEGKILAVNCLLDRPYMLKDSKEPCYILININAGELVQQQARIPLNICMVLDKSGSMSAGNKLEYVKKAALFVVDNLEQSDYFSLVTYDTEVYPTLPSARITRKEQLKSTIQALAPGSSTNLSGGMLEGYAQVAAHFEKGYVNRVLLLSDGLANRGITVPKQLQKIAADKNGEGYTLSAFGVGDNFNENLMTNLAEYGGANYYFIDSPDKIPQIFSSELQGLLSVVAQNTRLEIELAPDIRLLEVFGYRGKLRNNRITIKLNDLFSKEEKSILMKLECSTKKVCKIHLANILLTYDDVVIANTRITENFTKSVEITTDADKVTKNKISIVAENVALFESARLLDEAMAEVDRRDFEKARKSNALNQSYLQRNIDPHSSKRLKQQLLNVMRYTEEAKQAGQMEADALKKMQKRSKFDNYLQKKKR